MNRLLTPSIIATVTLVLFPGIQALSGGQELFLKGGDVSLLQAIEDAGGVYRVNGQPKDPLAIFKDHGWNAIRLRLFHTPTGTPPLVNDLAYTSQLGARVKKAGMRLLLDIHYSDTWADPGQQTKPKAWEQLNSADLRDAVFAYTRDAIAHMKDAGAMPDIVQIGNEIGPGMLWNDGRVGGGDFNNAEQWAKLTRLLQAGVDGVHEGAGGASVKTMIHVQMGGSTKATARYFDALTANGLDFDLIGLSYYPWWHSDGRGFEPLRENLEATIERFGKDVMVVETAYPWKPNCDDPAKILHKREERPLVPGILASTDGQRTFLEEILKTVRNAPDGRGLGVFYWAPEYIRTPDFNPRRNHLSLFDEYANALPGMAAFRESAAKQ